MHKLETDLENAKDNFLFILKYKQTANLRRPDLMIIK